MKLVMTMDMLERTTTVILFCSQDNETESHDFKKQKSPLLSTAVTPSDPQKLREKHFCLLHFLPKSTEIYSAKGS